METLVDNTGFIPEGSEWGKPAFNSFRPAYRQILVENGILNPDFTPNMETAERLGWKPGTPEGTSPSEARERMVSQLVADGYLTPDGDITEFGRSALGAIGN